MSQWKAAVNLLTGNDQARAPLAERVLDGAVDQPGHLRARQPAPTPGAAAKPIRRLRDLTRYRRR